MVKILSVDWDYFFPDTFPFDWGHRENVFMCEAIWNFRITSRNLLTKARAIDVFRPRKRDLETFWESIYPTTRPEPLSLCITESHRDLYTYLKWINRQFKVEIEVFNFDAHHDIHYGQKDEPECGNWVVRSYIDNLLQKYTLIYPRWRLHSAEGFGTDFEYDRYFKIPDVLPSFQFVFICRSSAWTPPWYDHKWLEFVKHWERYEDLWENKITIPEVLKARQPDMKQAIQISRERGW